MPSRPSFSHYNLCHFAERYWRNVVLGEFVDIDAGIHQHTIGGMIIAEAYRQASDELRPEPDETGETFYKKQYSQGAPDPFAEGDESVYNLAVDKLDAMLMSTPAYKKNPSRVWSADDPKEGTLVTALRRPIPPQTSTAAP
jgi:hypothetical protein